VLRWLCVIVEPDDQVRKIELVDAVNFDYCQRSLKKENKACPCKPIPLQSKSPYE